jgi:hypothetical protein
MGNDMDATDKARISYVALYDGLHKTLSAALKEQILSIDPGYRPSRINDLATSTLLAAMPGFSHYSDFVIPDDVYCAHKGIRRLDNWWKLSEDQQVFYRTAAECLFQLHANIKKPNIFQVYDATLKEILSKESEDHAPHCRAALRAILWNQKKTPEQLAKETHEIAQAYGISPSDYVFDESGQKAFPWKRVINEETRQAYRKLVATALESTIRHGMVSSSDFQRRGFVLPIRSPLTVASAQPADHKPG